MIRRSATLVLVLVLACAIAAPLVAWAKGGCARCGAGMTCCRAPAPRPGSCALSRACCSGADSDRSIVPHGAGLSIAALQAFEPPAPSPSRAPAAPASLVPLDQRITPPDPPPRPAA